MERPALSIQRLTALAVIPEYQSPEAAGLDLHAAIESSVVLEPGDVARIALGFAMAIPPGFEAQIRPRSGLASRHGITLPNAPGTIDSDYRGEVLIP
ncbi:MAG: dUTP diphosphatase, partial [Phycisphaerales bacterium]|nr:dUTP diphosphatase [Phycisphaerales bacterium]